ncbi:DNA mismatch repair endonuclease MutL [Poriferisphaera sp. WC338]|uniref:DNA mismatch repair endonuclease MutL n=1 Tax=Poriferisphaera sp. WC338 TaxID=3425129 RepID=UPI003D815739
MKIRKLSTLLINQIAAGEVIERPASVVKELVENSIDAGATQIDVVVEDGGRQLIRISDNGAGIVPNEMHLAVSPHATSKLVEPKDLEAIMTLGFRGEALASIASVSRLKLTSRSTRDGKTDEAGHYLEVAGDKLGEPTPCSCAPGTTIEVRDLFFNTPARRKFMRQSGTEFSHINDAVIRIAMIHSEVGFKLQHNGRKVIDLPPHQEKAQRVIGLVGKELRDGLLEFSKQDLPEHGGAKLWGMAGLPEIARKTGKFLYLCLNGRVIKDRSLLHAVKEAYRGLLAPELTPVAIIFLDMPPEDVDVNVHPTKAEVRFRKPRQYHGLIYSAIRDCLIQHDLMPTAQLDDGRVAKFKAPLREEDKQNEAEATQAFVDYFKEMAPKQKGFAFQQVRNAITDEIKKQDDTPLLKEAGLANDSFVQAIQNNAADTTEPILPTTNSPCIETLSTSSLAAQPIRILQVHNSYVVTEDEQGMIIIDQHALHERIMFEKLRKRVLGDKKSLESQRLLMPAIVDAGSSEQDALAELKPLLDKLGIEIEPIGPHVVAVQAFPSFLFSRNVEAEPFVKELIDKALEGDLRVSDPAAEENALSEVLDMMSCKAAVKAGDNMSEEELAALLAQREEIERSSSCPHGRPTSLRLSLKDLEKQFGRS